MGIFTDQEYCGNTILTYLIFLSALLASFLFVRIVGRISLRRLNAWARNTSGAYGNTIASGVRKYLMPVAYFTAFYLNTFILHLNDTMSKIVGGIVMAFAATLGAIFISYVATFLLKRLRQGKDENGNLAVKLMTWIVKIVVWVVALVLFLDNVGVKITSLVAGLGVGGIVIAFAAQSVLTDILCFFTIFFDKPFEVGDFIVAGEQMGTVEHIGVKTTRLRALSGEALIYPNASLTGSRISNFKTLQKRRVLFTLGVTYDTPYEKLKDIPGTIREIIEGVPDTEFGRAHFISYGAYSLNFEVVYFVLSADYDRYMDIHQQINFRIKEEFERLGIEFAFPTQSILLGDSAAQSVPAERKA